MPANKINIKKILHKIQYLKEEKDDVTSLLEEYTHLFLKEVRATNYESEKMNELYGRYLESGDQNLEKHRESPLENSSDKNNKDNKEETGARLPDCIKKIYKKIVIIVHPDKYYSSNITDEKKNEYLDIYKKVSSAADECDIIEILCAALALKVDISNIDLKTIESIEDACKEIEGFIVDAKNTYSWAWATTEEMQHKNHIINSFIEKNK
jgi:hypothetical protein